MDSDGPAKTAGKTVSATITIWWPVNTTKSAFTILRVSKSGVYPWKSSSNNTVSMKGRCKTIEKEYPSAQRKSRDGNSTDDLSS